MTAPTSECREAFENTYPALFAGKLETYSNGEYDSPVARSAWIAWQAAWNQRAAGAEGVAGDVLISRRELTELCEAIEEEVIAPANEHAIGFARGSANACKRIRRCMYDGSLAAPPDAVVTDEMVERGLQAAIDASDARLPRYSVVRAILEAALKESKHDVG